MTKELFAGPIVASMSFSDEPAATNFYPPSKVLRSRTQNEISGDATVAGSSV